MEAEKQSNKPESDYQSDPKKVEQILIERDGKFELVNSSDMQAIAMSVDSSDDHLGANSDYKQTQPNSNEQVASMEEHESNNLKKKDPIVVDIVNDHQDQSQSETDNGGKHSKELDDNPQSNIIDESGNDSDVTEMNKRFKSTSQVSFIVSEEKKTVTSVSPTRLAPGSFQTSSTTTLSHSNNRKLLIARSKSAPGFRNPNKNTQEEDLQRRERNEAAFRAWLDRKDKQLACQRQSESAKMKKVEEEIREKQRRNEAAYQAWLKSKTQEYLEQRTKERLIRPVTSINKDDGERRRVAFESWLARKQEAKQTEENNEQKSRKLEEEAATKSDSTVVAQAYKSWLHRKRLQAKDEELKREQYRKMYFRQSRKLKQSATLRFEGF